MFRRPERAVGKVVPAWHILPRAYLTSPFASASMRLKILLACISRLARSLDATEMPLPNSERRRCLSALAPIVSAKAATNSSTSRPRFWSSSAPSNNACHGPRRQE